MSGPGSARPDLCSIRAAAEQEELAEITQPSGRFAAQWATERSGQRQCGRGHWPVLIDPVPHG